jgi:hypothetical protein
MGSQLIGSSDAAGQQNCHLDHHRQLQFNAQQRQRGGDASRRQQQTQHVAFGRRYAL